MLTAAAALGGGEVLLAVVAGWSTPVVFALLLLPLLGFAMTTTMAMANTTVQTSTPNELRGRVLSVYLTVFAGSAPFGALVAGAAAHAFGTATSIAICGAVTLAAAGVVAVVGGVGAGARVRLRTGKPVEPATGSPLTMTGKD
jgi:hypothetical protein